jgi:hypothetical protein
MLYGELGRYPLNITVKLKILSFWSKLIDGKQSKLSSLIYRLNLLHPHNFVNFLVINLFCTVYVKYNLNRRYVINYSL